MANLICAKCNKEIVPEEMVECPHCWEIYHRECWEETSNCVTCKKFNPIYETVQTQKEMQKEEMSKAEAQNEEYQTAEDAEETPTQPMQNNIMMLVANVLLVLGVVLGIAVAVSLMTGGIKRIIIGVAVGAVIAALGWVLSALVHGFGELIANSQMTNYLLQKLAEKNEEEDDE